MSTSRDRRAWTIELQSSEDIPLEPGQLLRQVLLDSLDQFPALPPGYRRIARVIRPDGDETSDFYTLIADHIASQLVS